MKDMQLKRIRDTCQAKQLIITSGFYDLPNLLGVPGEDLPKVRHYYEHPCP
jgi:thioredoxin reductase (NADPH)